MCVDETTTPPLARPVGEPIGFADVRGDDYAIGRRLGEVTADEIAALWDDFMGPRMGSHFGTPPAVQARTCDWLRRNLDAVNPAIAAQIEGLADGSGLGAQRLYLMNHYAVLWPTEGLWCSSLALRTCDAGPMLAQNLDLGAEPFYFACRMQPSDGYAILSDRMLAMAWGCTGVNAAGLVIGASNLGRAHHRRPAGPPSGGIPNTMIPHTLLRRCATTEEAVAMAEALPDVCPAVSGYQLNVIDAGGRRAVIDKCGPRTLVRQCTADANFTTNCSLDEDFESWRTKEESDPLPTRDAQARATRIRAALESLDGNVPDVGWVERLFRAASRPDDLCRLGKGATGSYSRLGLFYFPASRTMRISNGPPCQCAYQSFSLGDHAAPGRAVPSDLSGSHR